jgi:hypothetical protein
VARVLPLTVAGVGLTGPFFNLFGPDWSLAVNCDWQLVRGGQTLATWESDDDELRGVISSLRGRSVVDVDIDDALVDPVFRLDDGAEIRIIADTDLDPWTFSADGLPEELVGYGPGGRAEQAEQQE